MFPHAEPFTPFVLVLLLSVLASLPVHRAAARRLGVAPVELVPIVGVASIAAILGARSLGLVLDGARGAGVELAAAGYRYPGAVIGVLLAYPLLKQLTPPKTRLSRCADLLTPGAGLALAVIRIECMIAGCCAGAPCTACWGLRYPAGSAPWLHQVQEGLIPGSSTLGLPVHPLPLYLMALALGVSMLCMSMLSLQRPPGRVVLVFVAVHESGKLALEHLRAPRVDALIALALVPAFLAWSLLSIQAMKARRAGRAPVRRARGGRDSEGEMR